VAVVLRRATLNRLSRLTPPAPIQRYEWAAVGDLVHLDIKPLARILQVGHRIHGDHRRKVKGAGYEFAHVAIDDRSRTAYVEVLMDQRGCTSAGFLRRVVGWFARRGVAIRRVLTDNGPGYCSDAFAAVAARHRIRLIRARPHHPQTNGKAERFIQTLIREWAYAVAYSSSWRRTCALRPWVRHYGGPHSTRGELRGAGQLTQPLLR
jgi:transposase InsO family protein